MSKPKRKTKPKIGDICEINKASLYSIYSYITIFTNWKNGHNLWLYEVYSKQNQFDFIFLVVEKYSIEHSPHPDKKDSYVSISKCFILEVENFTTNFRLGNQVENNCLWIKTSDIKKI